jgi:hypothetical protein
MPMKVSITFYRSGWFGFVGTVIDGGSKMEVELKDRPIKGDIISFGGGNLHVPSSVCQIRGDLCGVIVRVIEVRHLPTHSRFPHDPEIEIDVVVL